MSTLIYKIGDKPDITQYTRKDLIKCPIIYSTVSIYGTKDNWSLFCNEYRTAVLGPRIFWKRSMSSNVTYKNKKIYGKLDDYTISALFKAFHIDWPQQWCFHLIGTRKDILIQIFSGKITNPEKLCKYISKKYFKGVYSYHSLRDYAKVRHNVSLWDIYYYSTNPELMLREMITTDGTSLWYDILHSAKVLNQRVNPKWSDKRMYEEHQKQIETIAMSDSDKYSDEDVINTFETDGLSLITNNKECFLEGLKMHNCINSCYWYKVITGKYLILKGSLVGNEYVNLGINIQENTLVFDQVHTIRNGEVADCKPYIDFINKYRSQLLETSKTLTEYKNVATESFAIPW